MLGGEEYDIIITVLGGDGNFYFGRSDTFVQDTFRCFPHDVKSET